MPANPLNPVGVYIGNGLMMISLAAADPAAVSYEVQIAAGIDGPYYQYGYVTTETPVIYLHSLPPVTANVYTQIRAVAADKSQSAWVQVAKGQLHLPTIQMECTCLAGSRIPANAKFAVKQPGGRLMVFKAVAEVVFPDS